MDENFVMGIYCLKDRTFYYMDNGPAITHMDLDRLRTILIGRELIKPTRSKAQPNHYVMSLADARLEGHELSKIHLTKHIESMQKTPAVQEYDSPWS